jgi:hypothetical protein
VVPPMWITGITIMSEVYSIELIVVFHKHWKLPFSRWRRSTSWFATPPRLLISPILSLRMNPAMSKTVEQAIQELITEIADAEAHLNKKKETVNTLCGVAGLQPRYILAAAEDAPARGGWRPDEFYNKPLATVVRTILTARKAAGSGAASLDDIYDNMIAGGFKFDAKSDVTAKRALSISLAKNTVLFHKLPNGFYGLTAWYGIRGGRTRVDTEEEIAADAETITSDDTEDASESNEEATGEPSPVSSHKSKGG